MQLSECMSAADGISLSVKSLFDELGFSYLFNSNNVSNSVLFFFLVFDFCRFCVVIRFFHF